MKKSFKLIFKILLGLLVFAIAGFAAIMYFTSGMVTAADRFFQAIQDKDISAAYAGLSPAFQRTASEQDLEGYLKSTAIADFASASWDSRTVNMGSGNLKGSITTTSGDVIPLTLDFVKSDGEWKIYAIHQPVAGIQESPSPSREIPGEEALIDLVQGSTAAFAAAIREKDMSLFHQHISRLWQDQFTVAQLEETYGSFYVLGNGLDVMKNYTPSFDNEPVLDENGVMIISGHYATNPDQLHFQHKYIHEGLSWKLLGYSVQIQ